MRHVVHSTRRVFLFRVSSRRLVVPQLEHRCEGTPFFSVPGGGAFCQAGAKKVGINMEMMIANHWQMKLKLIVAVGFVSTGLRAPPSWRTRVLEGFHQLTSPKEKGDDT